MRARTAGRAARVRPGLRRLACGAAARECPRPGLRPSWQALLALALLSGCASGPVLDAGGVDPGLTPSTVTRHAVGRRVLWGGGIISSVNRERSTELEVLAYPLRENQRPDDRAAPLGRFLVLHPSYLETLDYSQGRRVTVRGRVAEVRQAEVGRAPRALPVVESEAIHLWPVGQDYAWRSWPVQIGFGIWVSN